MAFRKAQGSTSNGRDSRPKYRGVKLFGGQFARAGNIIVRQQGNIYKCGKNTYIGNDYTIHAGIDGIVVFSKKKKQKYNGRKYERTYVHVHPLSTVS